MRVYNNKEECSQASGLYQETKLGHSEEFYHSKSHFIYYINEGEGTWYIDDSPYNVKTGDVVIIPPNKRFYYKGCLKQICITSPSGEYAFEYHVRDVNFDEI